MLIKGNEATKEEKTDKSKIYINLFMLTFWLFFQFCFLYVDLQKYFKY